MAGCIGVKPDGALCRGVAARGSDWCPAHDPAREEARRRNASKAARAKPGKEIKDLKAQLEELASGVLDGTTEPKVGAVVTQIVNARTRLLETERKIRETEELEARLEELEALAEHQKEARRRGA